MGESGAVVAAACSTTPIPQHKLSASSAWSQFNVTPPAWIVVSGGGGGGGGGGAGGGRVQGMCPLAGCGQRCVDVLVV